MSENGPTDNFIAPLTENKWKYPNFLTLGEKSIPTYKCKIVSEDKPCPFTIKAFMAPTVEGECLAEREGCKFIYRYYLNSFCSIDLISCYAGTLIGSYAGNYQDDLIGHFKINSID